MGILYQYHQQGKNVVYLSDGDVGMSPATYRIGKSAKCVAKSSRLSTE